MVSRTVCKGGQIIDQLNTESAAMAKKRRQAAAAIADDAVSSAGSATRTEDPAAAGSADMPRVDKSGSSSSGVELILYKLARAAVIILCVQWAFRLGGNYLKRETLPPNVHKVPGAQAHDAVFDSIAHHADDVQPKQLETVYPLWSQPGTRVDVALWLSEDATFHPSTGRRIAFEQDYQIGDWDDVRRRSFDVDVSESVRNNGSLYAHVFVFRSPDSHRGSGEPDLPSDLAAHRSYLLTRYLPRRKDATSRRLFISSQNSSRAESSRDIISYWHPNVTISIAGDPGAMSLDSIHPIARQFITLDPTDSRDASGRNGFYLPVVYLDEFWLLREHMQPIDSRTQSLTLHFELSQTSMMRMQTLAALDASFRQQALQMGGSGAEFEELKRILLETNVYLLATTVLVSLLHAVFEFLAFKNDIQHFRSRKDNVGLSVNAILINIGVQAVVLLYLADSAEETSWMILLGSGVGLAIEVWKLTRSVDVRIRRVPGSMLPYRLRLADKRTLSVAEQQTKQYDEQASHWLLLGCIPLLLAYAVYALAYGSFRSRYSFLITTLAGFVYVYGFLSLVPALWINYRLKSVAHMPRRTLVYKFLNTIVDDFAALIVKQPLLARLAAFRDDVVFIIYLYQSYIYRTDDRRANEYGQVDAKSSSTSGGHMHGRTAGVAALDEEKKAR